MRAIVVGGGTMGAGIAQALLHVGATVAIVEQTTDLAVKARQRIAEALSRGEPEVAEEQLARLGTAVGLDELPPADIVIEAVPEVADLKKDVLIGLQRACPDALLASNTSSLSITDLADALDDPTALVGMHFFNPVSPSRLVELVIGSSTKPDVVATAREWVKRLGKEVVEVKDSPGFATSRLGLALGLEAIRMLEDGVAGADDIDRAMVLGYKHPVGPLELTDRIGLDVRLAIARHLSAELGERFTPPRLLVDLVGSGKLGRKSGSGFYQWRDGRRVEPVVLEDGDA